MGKDSSPPPVPDYTGAANAQAAASLDAQRAATKANRIDQYTPYGSSIYTQSSPDTFDQKGYDTALSAYQQSLANPVMSQTPTSNPNSYFDQDHGYFGYVDPTSGNFVRDNGGTTQTANTMAMPTRDEFTSKGDPDGGWSQIVSLTPIQQQLLDKQNAISNQYADITQTGLNSVAGLLSNPQFDTSQLPDRAVNPGQTGQQAILSRLEPTYNLQDEQLRTRLANQGITLGSDAYNREMNLQGQNRNDAEQQAALQGINLDAQNRSSAFQEQSYMQDRPLNLLNALRNGVQLTNPTFSNVPQQGVAQTPDLMGAANAQYNGLMGDANAQAASDQSTQQGVVGIAMAAAMAY